MECCYPWAPLHRSRQWRTLWTSYTVCPSLCAAKVPRKLKSLWELIAWIPGTVCICTLVAETAWDSRKSCSCRTLCPGHSQGLTGPAAAVREARTRGSGCVTGLPTYGCASRMPPNSLPWLVVVCRIILHNPNPGLWLDPCPHICPQFYHIYIDEHTHSTSFGVDCMFTFGCLLFYPLKFLVFRQPIQPVPSLCHADPVLRLQDPAVTRRG